MQFHMFLISILCAALRIGEPRSEKRLIPEVSSTRQQMCQLFALLEKAVDPVIEAVFALGLCLIMRSTAIDTATSLALFF